MTITDTSLATNIWTDINAVLVSANIVASVISGSVSSTVLAGINGSYNDKHVSQPQVILNPITISEQSPKFGGTYGRRAINVIVEVYHPNGRAVDYMADQVRTAIATNSISGITLVGVSDEPDFFSPGDNKIKSRVIVFHFDREV